MCILCRNMCKCVIRSLTFTSNVPSLKFRSIRSFSSKPSDQSKENEFMRRFEEQRRKTESDRRKKLQDFDRMEREKREQVIRDEAKRRKERNDRREEKHQLDDFLDGK